MCKMQYYCTDGQRTLRKLVFIRQTVTTQPTLVLEAAMLMAQPPETTGERHYIWLPSSHTMECTA